MKKSNLPVFPIGIVVLPGTIQSLQIFEPRYIDMVKKCLKDKVGFLQMSDIIADTLQKCTFVKNPSLEDYIASDAEARRLTKDNI